MIRGRMWIGGRWVDAGSNETREIINPFNQEVIAVVAEGGRRDARAAIDAACTRRETPSVLSLA